MLGGLAVAAGILGSGFTVLAGVLAGVSTLLGAGSAAVTLAIPRAADEPAALEEAAEVGRAGLTPEDTRPLLLD